MDLKLTLSFLVASIVLAILPGPDNIFVLTESVTKGKKNGIALSAGLSSGVIVHTITAATGLSLILQNSAIAFQIVKYLGAIYLFYLAFQSLIEKGNDFDLELGIKNDYNFFKLYSKGFLMNVLNPKVTLFFIAFLPQFISKTGFNVTLQMLILGFIFMVQAFVIFSLIAIVSGSLHKYLNNTKFWNKTKKIKAFVLAILGFTLLLSEK